MFTAFIECVMPHLPLLQSQRGFNPRNSKDYDFCDETVEMQQHHVYGLLLE